MNTIRTLLAASFLAMAGITSAFATGKPEVVLIHGAFADGSSWSKVIALLQQKGIEVTLSTQGEADDYRNVVRLRGALADGSVVSVAGTLSGTKFIEKVVGIDGFSVDLVLAQNLAFFSYEDRPGVVGKIGTILGRSNVNIASMHVGRRTKRGRAIVRIDSEALTLSAPALVWVPPLTIHGFQFVPDTSGHVVTLELTHNKMPRWLSEGISVYEELQENPTWGQRMTPRYRQMILDGELTPVGELSSETV